MTAPTSGDATPHRFALDVIRPWPEVARRAASEVIRVHGSPDRTDDDVLRWDGLGPWKRVVVRADDGDDDLEDVIESVIDATIPDDRRDAVDEVAVEFRVTIDGGEVTVRGPDLHVNAITLNVVHAMVHDGLAPQRARERRSRDLADLRDGHPPADADELHFADDAPHGEPRSTGHLGPSGSGTNDA